MSSIGLVKKLEGLQTIESIQKKLRISRLTAIKYVHLLRKQGFVETSGGARQPRFFRISALKLRETGNEGIYDIINKYSPIKISAMKSWIIGKKLTIEETLIRAIETKEFRTILASLALFNHINNWNLLYRHAKEKTMRKKIGALYDIARMTFKTRKIDKRIYNKMLKCKEGDKYIIDGLKSKDFAEIEKKWGIFIPFNISDLLRYKEWRLK